MKNKELFDRTVGILTQAYFKGNLEHGSPCGCAVGNLVVSAMNMGEDDDMLDWVNVFCSNPQPMSKEEAALLGIEEDERPVSMHQEVDMSYYKGTAKAEIDSTGYSVFQLAAIEKAFESKRLHEKTSGLLYTWNPTPEEQEQAMFDGLCAVYDVLCQIHEVTEEDNVTKAELVFVK